MTRILDYAKEKNISSKEIMDLLHKLGFESVKSHFKGIDEPMQKALDEHFAKQGKGAPAAQQPAKPAAEHKPAQQQPAQPAQPAKPAADHKPGQPAKPAQPTTSKHIGAPDYHRHAPAEPKQPAKPAVPAQQQPAQPVQHKPAHPAHHAPQHPQKPAQPTHGQQQPQKPAQPVTQAPAQQQPAKPVQPQQQAPAQQQPQKPAQPTHGQQQPQKPVQPVTQAPAQQQPAKPVQPQQQAPAQQQPQRPAQPAQGQQQPQKPAQPVTQAPAQQQPAKPVQPQQHGRQHGHHRRDDRNAPPVMPPAPPKDDKTINVNGPLSVKEICDLMNLQRIDVIKKLMNYSIMNVNQRIPVEVVTKIAESYNYKVNLLTQEAAEQMHDEADDHSKMVSRSPIVTIMGHVDHGKTSLLDAVRKTNVVASEDGGITQHIGAYQVDVGNGQKVTFLDTPGHEAFTQMRAHGSKVTDIAILVVAADDGVQPQTIEAIDHAIAAEIPIIVAINKIDKPGANLDNVKKQLAEHGLVPEDWGGDTVCVEVSAKQRINIDGLLEIILLVSEMRQLKADPTRKAIGVVIESKLDKGVGPIATVLVQKGTLRVGDPVIVGNTCGKVRNLTNDRGKRVNDAGPSVPVEVVGLDEVPQAGDKLKVVSSEKVAREIAVHRQMALREERMKMKKHISLSDLFNEIQTGKVKDLNIILKGDVAGSIIALSESLRKLSNDKVRVNVIHNNVGAITENDVLLAAASNAIIIGFRVRPSAAAEKLAETEAVDIKVYRIIYDALDQIQHAMVGMYDPTFKEVTLGRAEVKQLFKIPHVGFIAGSQVKDGKITRDASIRVVRGGIEVYEGKIKSLRRFKDDAKEVAIGMECGIGLDKFNDLKEGDILEAFEIQEVKATMPATGGAQKSSN